MSQKIETNPPMQLIPSAEYPEHFIGAVDNARQRIGVLSMVMTVDETTRPMYSALERAAEPERGVHEILLPDAYSTMVDDNIWRYQLWRAEGRQSRGRIEALQARLGGIASYPNVDLRYIHPYTMFDKLSVVRLFAGRNHVKSFDMDDATDLGGVMWGRRYFDALDYMLRINHAGAANFMYEYKEELLQHGRIPGVKPYRFYDINDANRIALDVGRPGQSYIYGTVNNLARTAEEFTVITQYPPKGLFRHVLAGRSKDSTRIFHNRPEQFVQPGRSLRRVEANLPPKLDYHSALDGFFIHAKAVLARLKDGTTVTIATSHNQQESLVRMGTAEVALISRDAAVYRAFQHYLRQLPLEQ